MENTLTLNEFATQSGIPRARVRSMLVRGKITGHKPSGANTLGWQIPTAELVRAQELYSRHKPTEQSAGDREEWLTVKEAAQLTGLHPSTLHKQARRGKLQSRQEGGKFMVRRSDVAALKPRSRRTKQAEPTDAGGHLTVKEAAKYKKLSVATIARAIRSGKLPATNVQTSPHKFAYYIKQTDLDNFVPSRRSPKESPKYVAVTVTAAPTTNNNTKLLELSRLVAAGLAEVEALDVRLRIKSE